MKKPYDIVILTEDDYRFIAADTKRAALDRAKDCVDELLADNEAVWTVRVLTGPQLIWQDSSRQRMLGEP